MNSTTMAIDKQNREQTIDFLRNSRLFAHFPVEILEKLVSLSTIVRYSKGNEILYEGQKDNSRLFFLLEGSVSIHAGGEYILTLQRKGDIFGEIGVITQKPSTASVFADTDLKVLTMNTKDIGSYDDSDSATYQHVIYRVFSMILADKLILTTHKAQHFETTNRILKDQAQELVSAKLELDSQFIASLRMGKKLAESEDRYRKLFNNAQVGLFRTKIETGEILECNQYIVDMFGYDTPESVKKAVKSLDVYANTTDRKNVLKELAQEGKIINKSILFRKKNGSFFWGSYSINVFHEQGIMEGVLVDITEQKVAEEKIKASLQEKQTLLDEIHHRVKNNMQIIASLLKMQLNRKDKQDVDSILKENMGRVYSMAAIHESLHQSEKLSEIDFKVYLNKLSQMLSQTYSVDPSKVTFQIDTPELKLAIDKANPLGLVLNELISNSLKYAFPDDVKGTITIKSSFLDEETVELIVADDGIGLPDGFDWKTTDTLGLKLVQRLVEDQLDGSIDMENKNGTQLAIRFKLESKCK